MKKEVHEVPDAPKAIGPYSPAVKTSELTFFSGQIPIDPKTGKLVDGDFGAQVDQVLKNISAMLKHFNYTTANIAKVVVFLVDLSNFADLNVKYESFMAGSKPARTTIQVAALPLKSLVEIEVTCAKV